MLLGVVHLMQEVPTLWSTALLDHDLGVLPVPLPQVSPRPSPRRPLPPMRPGGQGEGYRQNTEVMVEEEEEGCGPECRNLLHEVDHPKEDERCPDPNMVIDIWGYCRHIFHEERRDWSWWENLRQYEHANRNSGANNYRPTINEYSQWPGNWHSG